MPIRRGFSGPQPISPDWASLFSGFERAGGHVSDQTSRLIETSNFGANPGGLRMLSYAPDELALGAPLVVTLHGCGQSAEAYDHGAGWSALADRLGFVVLAPEQRQANNFNGCFSWFQPDDTARDLGEAASIRQMIAHLVAHHDLDPRRVFITGLSAGGAMACAMLATYPEVFAGGAIIAGLAYGAASNVQEALSGMRRAPQRSPRAWGDLVRAASFYTGPWPSISVWHGDADTTVRPGNADAIIAQWTDVHGIGQSPTAESEIDGYPHRVWRDGAGRPVLESYTITGMGHGTPIRAGEGDGDCGAPGPFVLAAGISSSYRIAEFWSLTEGGSASTEQPRPRGFSAAASPKFKGAAAAASPLRALSGLDPQKVIASALKAAGLTKKP